MAKRRARPSTEPAEAPELHAVTPFDPLAAGLTELFAPRLEMEPDPQAVRRALADPARIDARLAELPAAALLVLEHLADMGGEVAFQSLAELLSARFDLDERTTDHAAHLLIDAALVVPLLRYGDIRSFALLDLSAGAIARRVRGLSLPRVEDPREQAPALDAAPDVALRDRVALLASVAHLPMRFTQNRDTNRTSAKKLAAIVGWESEAVAATLDRAIGDGVLGAKDKHLAPIVERLHALARGEAIASEDDANGRRIAEWVGPRWVSREALVRALVAAEVRRSRGLDHFFGGNARDFAEAERRIDRAPLRHATVDEVELVRAASAPERSGHGDGHVTPSFEVMLGPRADPELVATLALATEPGRFDLVLTRRITPRSISAAVGLGLEVGEILDALGKVGRHGVPDNVRAMVEDWSKTARTVRVSKVWALEASSSEAADAVVRTLGERVVARPAPTLVLVSGESADPTRELLAAGLGGGAPAQPLAAPRRAAATLPEQPPTSLTSPADPALRARLAAQLASGLALVEEPEPRVFIPWRALDELLETLQGDDAHLVEDFTRLFVRLWEAAEALFMEELPPTAMREAFNLVEEHPLAIVPWLVLTPRDRRRTLTAAGSLPELVLQTEQMGRAPRTTDGMQAERLLRHPRLRELLAPLERRAQSPSAPSEPMTPSQIRERFTEAATLGAVVSLRLRIPSGEKTLAFLPERIHERGRDVALLGIDPETEKSLAFPLDRVIALTPM